MPGEFGFPTIQEMFPEPKKAANPKELENNSMLFGLSGLTKDLSKRVVDTSQEIKNMKDDINTIKNELAPLGRYIKLKMAKKQKIKIMEAWHA